MTLSGQQGRVYKYLTTAGIDADVAIVSIYFNMHKKPTKALMAKTQRAKHQAVGSVIARLNVTLRGEGYEIVPGQIKRTYRLTAYKAK